MRADRLHHATRSATTMSTNHLSMKRAALWALAGLSWIAPAGLQGALGQERFPTPEAASQALIEAGVDIDLPEVWRAAAGLDSIAQAAGR